MSHRATLWLADGHRHLARWATEGTHFSEVQKLKRVPTGHDSAWIAGEAIAAEEVKLKDAERDQRVRPSWRSVLAIPVFVGDGRLPDVAAAVITFGLSDTTSTLLERLDGNQQLIEEISDSWRARLNTTAFPAGRR